VDDREVAAASELFTTVLSADLDTYHPWLYDYCGDLAHTQGTRRYLRHLDDLFEFAGVDPRGATVVDAGCGFCFTLLAMGLLGAESLRGIDTSEIMIGTVRAYLPLLPPALSDRLDVTLGDVRAMPYESGSVDVMLSIEAISHYREVSPFAREAYRVLRPGGVLVISDGNNGLNPWLRWKTKKIWDVFELGNAEAPLDGFDVEHGYRDRRRDWIAEHYPELPAEEVSRRTFGLDTTELAEVCRRLADEGEMPNRRYRRDRVPVNPDDGSVIERMFNPYALARELRRSGFETRVRGYWGGAAGRRSVRLADRLLGAVSPVSMVTARAFRVAARKR
jgi:SAM-dependent methyltransferase